jgi:hypothetical protein
LHGTGGTAAHGEPLEKSGDHIGEAEGDYFLVVVNVITTAQGIDPRKHTHVGDRNQGDSHSTGAEGVKIGVEKRAIWD